MPDVILKDAGGEPRVYSDIDSVSLPVSENETATFISQHLIQNQVQADWNQTDNTQPDYIKNKPEIFEAEDELPEINAEEDEGKVLGVLNGAWNKIRVSVSGGGSDLPEINVSEDEGKVLGVVNGVWDKMTANFSGGEGGKTVQSDWIVNDVDEPAYIKNRPFYEDDPKPYTFIQGNDIPFNYDAYFGGYINFNTPTAEMLYNWNGNWSTAKLVFDGIEYNCEAQNLQGMKVIGNLPLLMGTGNNGMPFIAMAADAAAFGEDIIGILSLVDMPIELLSFQSLNFIANDSGKNVCEIEPIIFTEGEVYTINWDYDIQPYQAIAVSSGLCIGDPQLIDSTLSSTGAPFAIYTHTIDGETKTTIIASGSNSSYNVAIMHTPTVYHDAKCSAEIVNIQTLDSKFINNVPWDKVSNKPFGWIPAGSVVVDETFTFNSSADLIPLSINSYNIVVDAEYQVYMDGTAYRGVGVNQSGMTGILILDSNEQEFAGIVNEYGGLYFFSANPLGWSDGTTYDINAVLASDAPKKISEDFLPENFGLPPFYSSDNGKVLTVTSGGQVAAWQTPASGLPDATSSDVGKALMVNSSGVAQWSKIDALPARTVEDAGKCLVVNEDGNSVSWANSLPTVTAEDAGKFLRVSAEGAWIVEAIPKAEEAVF